jgi:spore maturation protein SpmA
MALSRIWAAFILVSILVAAVRYAFVPADKEIFSTMVTGKAGDTVRVAMAPAVGTPGSTIGVPAAPAYRVQKADGIIGTCSIAVTLAIGLIGIMALFMGLVSIAEAAGGMRFLARITRPFFSKLFPDVPPGHPAMGHMVMNFSANLLGLDNAATPFALKAMESLQEINPDKSRASNPQIMFLCLHQSGLQLIPVSVIAILAANGAKNPTDVFIPIVIATFLTTLASMSVVAIRQRINLFQPAILGWIGSLSVLIAALVVYLKTLNAEGVQSFSRAFSSGLILLIFLVIVGVALYRKVNIFDAFVQGAKGGFDTAVRIIPYLVGILVAISMLRTSGTFDAIIEA